MIPKYQKQIEDAKSWGKVASDIDDVIDNINESPEWKEATHKTVDSIIEQSTNGDDILANIEKAIDDVDIPSVVTALEKVMKGMEELNYLRDNTVIENRAERRIKKGMNG
jgi:flagellin-like hook-associated protein FlgL